MSKISDFAKLETIIKYINDIEKIVNKHNSIENSLTDMEGQYAIMMCLIQIGEVANRIDTEEIISALPIKEVIGFRNIVTHQYDGINLQIVEGVIEKNIPEFKNQIEIILKK